MNTPTKALDLKDYRAPVVTSIGVILGFLLGFLAQWVSEDNFALRDASDGLTFACSVCGALLLFTTLFRMLSPDVAPEQALMHYRWSLRLYMAGVAVPLLGLLLAAFI